MIECLVKSAFLPSPQLILNEHRWQVRSQYAHTDPTTVTLTRACAEGKKMVKMELHRHTKTHIVEAGQTFAMNSNCHANQVPDVNY